MTGLTIEQLNVGDAAEFAKTISEADVYLFAGITGDFNPAHVNEEYARNSMFKTRIAHGLLVSGLISTVLGTKLPGPGSIYVTQQLKFLAPVLIGDTVTARVEIVDKNEARNRVTLRTTCTKQDGTIVIDGEASIMPPKARS